MSERRAGFCLYKLRVHTGASFSGLRAGQLSRRVRSSTRLDWQSQNLLFWCVVRVCGGNGPGCVCELLLPLFTSPLHLRFRLSASASSRSYLSAAYLAGAGPSPLPPWLILPAPSGRVSRRTRQFFGSNRGKQTQVLLSR